jgi:phosphoribosylamine-glycine ligase
MKKILIGLATLLFLCACAHKESVERSYTLLPIPQEIETLDGDFTITNGTRLYINAPADDKNAIAKAYTLADSIHFDNAFCRRDIGARALKAQTEE